MPDTLSTFRILDWTVDPASGILRHGDEEIAIEPRVMSLLAYLAQRPGQVISRQELEDAVWTGTVVGYDALTTAMIKLRKAFGDDSRHPRIIQTVAKRGYRLIAPVQWGTVVSKPAPAPMPVKTVSLKHYAYTLLGLLALAAALAVTLLPSPTPKPADEAKIPPPASGQPTRLAVLPFDNLNDDASQEYFSDGITEDLIIDLSRYSGVQVVARRTAFLYKHRRMDIQTIAKELGVSYLIEGSTRRDGDRLRVTVQLVDTHTGLNIWAGRFDRQTGELFNVQDDIRNHIFKALSVSLTEEERNREQLRYTRSFEAYDNFLKGQASLVKRSSARDNDQARKLMETAVTLDPEFARAHAALGLIHADAYRFDWTDNPRETAHLALETGERAVRLDPNSPQAHWILGYIYLFVAGDHDKALAMGERTLQLDPRNADGHTLLGVTHVFGGHPEKAKLLVQSLIQHHQNYPSQVPSILGLSNLLLGNYAESVAAYEESLLINQSRVQTNVYLAVALYRMGRAGDADWQVGQLYALHPDFRLATWAERQPFRDKVVLESILADLRKLGVE